MAGEAAGQSRGTRMASGQPWSCTWTGPSADDCSPADPTLARVEGSAEGRREYAFEGLHGSRVRLPSVTTVLAATRSEYAVQQFESWRAKVGGAVADYARDRAAAVGTEAHAVMEKALGVSDDDAEGEALRTAYMCAHVERCESLYAQAHASDLLAWCSRHVDRVYCAERMIASAQVGVAGTVDCVADVVDPGEGPEAAQPHACIVDWKCLRRAPGAWRVADYRLQVLMYGAIWNSVAARPAVSGYRVVMSVADPPHLLVASGSVDRQGALPAAALARIQAWRRRQQANG